MNTTVFERHRVSENVLSHSLSSSVLSSFWVEDAGVDSTLPTLSGTLACDLAIVGAGYTGLWTAIEAKRATSRFCAIVCLSDDEYLKLLCWAPCIASSTI